MDVVEAVPLGADVERDGYRLHISYRFDGRSQVWLDDIGVVSPSGELNYVYRRPALIFRTVQSGPVLASVTIGATAFEQPMPHGDEYPSPVPAVTKWFDLPPTPRIKTAIAPPAAAEALSKAINDVTKRYPTDCGVGSGCWLSPWTLINDDRNIQAEVSLKLVFAADGAQTIVTVQYAKRQGYRGSSKWQDGGPVVDTAAPPFLAKVRSAIAGAR